MKRRSATILTAKENQVVREKSWLNKIAVFFAGQAITLFGSSIVQIAIIWFVAMQTSSGSWVTILTLCSFLPQMLISLFAGVWADRYNRKKLIIVADAIIALATLILAIFMMANNISQNVLVAIILVSIVRSIGAGIQSPAISAVIPQLVPDEHLMRVNGINGSIQSIVQFASPAVAGAIMAAGPIYNILFIDVITAIIGISLLALLKIPKHKVSQTTESMGLLANIKGGINYAFGHSFVGKLLLTYGTFIFLSVPSGFLVVLMIQRTFGNNYLYFTVNEMIGFAGMALGGLLLGIWGGFRNRNTTLLIGLLAYAIFSIILGFVSNFWLFAALMLGIGLAIPVVQTSVMTQLQEKVEPDLQGRVFSLLSIMFTGFMPLGMAIFGPLADNIRIQTMVIVCGVLILALALSVVFAKGFYRNGILVVEQNLGVGTEGEYHDKS